MLILFVMNRLSKPIALELLTELTMCDDRISYFDVTECIEKLVKTKHLLLKDGKYTLTAKGAANGKILEDDLPYSVRTNAEQAVSRINELLMLESLISVSKSANEKGGFDVRLSLSDGIGDILALELYAGSAEQADKLEKGFRKNAGSLYHDIIANITK